MKRTKIIAFTAIVTMVLSLFAIPCHAQDKCDKPFEIDLPAEGKDVMLVCEQQPEFPGGMRALMDYLKKEIRYPKKCSASGIEGRAFVRFIVDKNGKIKKVVLFKSSGNQLLDKEAIRVVKKMPRWNPGKNKGKEVNVRLTLPVNFKLDKPAPKVNEGGDDFTFIHRETQPEYPGGMKAFTEYIKLSMRYPEECVKNRIEGRAFVRFCIDTIGNVGAVEIIKSSGNNLLDEEAVRLIKETPEKWYPAKHFLENGTWRSRECSFVMPIVFKLGNDDSHDCNHEEAKNYGKE